MILNQLPKVLSCLFLSILLSGGFCFVSMLACIWSCFWKLLLWWWGGMAYGALWGSGENKVVHIGLESLLYIFPNDIRATVKNAQTLTSSHHFSLCQVGEKNDMFSYKVLVGTCQSCWLVTYCLAWLSIWASRASDGKQMVLLGSDLFRPIFVLPLVNTPALCSSL